MPLLAHSSNELVFDIFDKKIKITDVNKFVISNNILVYNIRNDVFKFELSKLENTSLILQNPSFFKLPTGIHEIKMSKNGSKFGILLKNSTFYVFEDSTLLFSKEKINSFEISDNFVGFETEKDFIIKDLENLKVIHKSHYNYQKYFVFNKFSILVTNKLKNEKEDIFKLYKVSKEEFEEIGNFNSLVNVKIVQMEILY